jgi:two-component system phosphate regulon response regulator PhoB
MKTILVVDDEPVIRSLAEEALRSDGWSVRTAADVPSALKAIERDQPDLIFLDLALPGTSGVELARRLRADTATAAIPIVCLTGLVTADCPDADAVLSKPFTPAKIRAYAANWV